MSKEEKIVEMDQEKVIAETEVSEETEAKKIDIKQIAKATAGVGLFVIGGVLGFCLGVTKNSDDSTVTVDTTIDAE